jgi:uncharacterized protein YfaS (alpha-2-macroglobulin family)
MYKVEFPSGTERNNQLSAIALKDGRCAIMHAESWWYSSESGATANWTYTITDRPVYRPGQTVNFRSIVRHFERSEFKTDNLFPVNVTITDPKGRNIYQQKLSTNQFGAVSGSVALEAEPPLGVYRVQVSCDVGALRPNYCWFRVEEYKKPEFLVEVSPEKAQAKLGEAVKAKITAKYYFGAPVVEATVKYRVMRSTFSYYPQYRGDYDWFYGSGYDRFNRRDSWGDEELIAEGTATTDAEGNVLVEFDTQKALKEQPDRDQSYTISAEVTDASRRVIEGSGTIKLTRQEFYANLRSTRGFYAPGDTVEIELTTENASGAPVQSKGKIDVARLVYIGEKDRPYDRHEISTEEFSTPAEGRAFFRWQTDSEGFFSIKYSTKDSWGGTVEGETNVWVVSQEFKGTEYNFRDIEILTDKRTYADGETARLMLSCSFADSHVWLSEETGTQIVSSRIVRVEGKSRVIELPITGRHTPNFFVRAVVVRNGQVHQELIELFAPPVKQFVKVAVESAKPEYKPGEKASMTLTTTDYAGKPVQCELSLSVFDKSILYIQPETGGTIQNFFYGQRRYNRLGLRTSLEFTSEPKQDDTNKYDKFKTHTLSEDWYAIHVGGGLPVDVGRSSRGRLRMEEQSNGAAFSESEGADDVPQPAAEPVRGGLIKGDVEEKQKSLKDEDGGGGGDPGKPQGNVEPQVRKAFADSAFWSPTVTTDAITGKATVEFNWPDTLTTWKASAVAITTGTEVGSQAAEIVTTKNLLVRLEAPRFFVERDLVVISGIVHNYLKTDKEVRCELSLPGDCLKNTEDAVKTVSVPKGADLRVEWLVRATKEGMAKILVKSLTDEESDAVEMEFPVLVHGCDKAFTYAGVLRGGEGKCTFEITVPAERRADNSELLISVAPSMASSVIESLPYLLDYPYGCVEQTMSRFLPVVVVADTLKELGLNLEQIGQQRKAFAAQPDRRVSESMRKDPVFDTAQMGNMIKAGLQRLYDFQHADGGWGWWQNDSSDPYMTAYVVYGLVRAQNADVAVDQDRLSRALDFLTVVSEKEELIHRAAYEQYVLSIAKRSNAKLVDRLYEERDDMTIQAKAFLALTLKAAGDDVRAETVCRNLEDFVKTDEKNGTCWWSSGNDWWYWYNDDIETNAWVLNALVNITPDSERTHQLAKWIVMNRQGMRWKSTKDTAIAIYCLCEYVRVNKELSPNYTFKVDYDNGRATLADKLTADNVFAFNNELMLTGEGVDTGKRTVTITKEGEGSLYWTANLKYFTLEEDIKGSAAGLSVARQYYRLTPRKVVEVIDGRQVPKQVWDRSPIAHGSEIESGSQIEVELTIEADNDYEYLVFEDPKPAGCEPVELRSGYTYGSLCSNMELRDEKVSFFVGWMPKGKHVLSYKLRAEIPGEFHALPATGYPMYVPRVKGTADEMRMKIKD